CLRSSLVMRGTGTDVYCDRPVPALSTLPGISARCDPSAGGDAIERDDARARRRFGRDGRACRGLALDRPARRPLSAVDAAQEDLTRLAPDAVVVAPREVAVEEIPKHRKPRARRFGCSPYGKSSAASSPAEVENRVRSQNSLGFCQKEC